MSNLFVMDVKSDVTKVLNHITYNKLKILDPFYTQSIKAVFSTDITVNSIFIETSKKSEAMKLTKKISSVESKSMNVYENSEALSRIENYCVYSVSTGFPEEESLSLVGSINLKNLISHLFSMGQEVVRIGLWDSESEEENYASLVIFSPESDLLGNFDYDFEFQDEEESEVEANLEDETDLEGDTDLEDETDLEGETDFELKVDSIVEKKIGGRDDIEEQNFIESVPDQEEQSKSQDYLSLKNSESLIASLQNSYDNLQLDFESNSRENVLLTQKCKKYELQISKITGELTIAQDQLLELQNAIKTLINLSQIQK